MATYKSDWVYTFTISPCEKKRHPNLTNKKKIPRYFICGSGELLLATVEKTENCQEIQRYRAWQSTASSETEGDKFYWRRSMVLDSLIFRSEKPPETRYSPWKTLNDVWGLLSLSVSIKNKCFSVCYKYPTSESNRSANIVSLEKTALHVC